MSTTPSPPDLVKVTEIFLIPSSFLVAALGTADTNLHRAMVSLLGLFISILWWVCSQEAMSEINRALAGTESAHPRRTRILVWLPVVFMCGWLISTIGHALYWNQRLGA